MRFLRGNLYENECSRMSSSNKYNMKKKFSIILNSTIRQEEIDLSIYKFYLYFKLIMDIIILFKLIMIKINKNIYNLKLVKIV